MKAAVVSSFSAPLEIVERDIPVPTAGQVLVRLETCGLCHTDIHAAGRTRVIAEVRSIEDGNDAFAAVLSGSVPARLVFEYAPVPAPA